MEYIRLAAVSSPSVFLGTFQRDTQAGCRTLDGFLQESVLQWMPRPWEPGFLVLPGASPSKKPCLQFQGSLPSFTYLL